MWCFCVICYHFYSLKNVRNTHEGVLFLVKLQVFSQQLYEKQHSSMGVFHVSKIVQNDTKWRKASHILSMFRKKVSKGFDQLTIKTFLYEKIRRKR